MGQLFLGQLYLIQLCLLTDNPWILVEISPISGRNQAQECNPQGQ